ncbi:MAG: hypothetical protein ACRDD1_04120, partial [Planctomycetia bacterium]
PVDRWIYYCVDDFSVWPGLDGPMLAAAEARLVPRMDRIVVVGDELRRRVEALGRSADVLTHGVDLDHWTAAESLKPHPALADLPRPIALFWGVVDRRLDIDWLRALTSAGVMGSTVLVGPEQNPNPAVHSLPGLVRIGATPLDELPAMAVAAAVLVMPYADLPVTRAMQPLKLKEYLATGRPTVVRRLPAVEPWADALDACTNAEGFTSAVRSRRDGAIPPEQRAARERLTDESWDAKAARFAAIIDETAADG